MDEIEYLEEYEDLILPTMSAHSTVTKNRVNTNQLTTNMADDEDSSSIDQDIFESLFDDHSDDESIMQKKVPAKLSQRSERSSRVSRMSMDSLDMLVKDLGEPLNATADQQNKATNKPSTKPSTTKPNQSTGKVMPKAATTSAPTTTKAASTSSHTTKDINNKTTTKSDTAATKSTIDERNARTKSVATVRPTVQQTTQSSAKQTNSNTAATSSATTSTTYRTSLNATTASSKQDAKDTAPTVSSSNNSTTATISTTAARKQVAAATSTTGNTGSNSTVGSSTSKAHASGASPPKRVIERSQTTIIKPEKPQIKDPAEDPLSLENVDNETDSDTESFLYSDISADTFVSLSDVDEDDEERQVIELSNDSNYDRVNLDKIRGSTPSPTVSEDDKSVREREDSPMKILSKRDDKTTEGSALEINANATNECANIEEATTSQQKQIAESTTTKNAKPKTKEGVDKSPNVSDTNLHERIDTVRPVTNTVNEEEEEEQKELTNQKDTNDDVVEPIVDAEINITVNEEEKCETTPPIPQGSATECNNAMDDDEDDDPAANTTAEGIQEPSEANTTTMDKEMKECQNDDEELNAEEETEEGEEEDGGDVEMEEDEMEDEESNAANTSNEAVDALPNKSNDDLKQTPNEISADMVESHDNADANEISADMQEQSANDDANLEESQEPEKEQNSDVGTLVESAVPQEKNDTSGKSEENSEEENDEVEKEVSNKRNAELAQTAKSVHSEDTEQEHLGQIINEETKADEENIINNDNETLKDNEPTKAHKEKGKTKTVKADKRDKKTLENVEFSNEISDSEVIENEDLNEKFTNADTANEKDNETSQAVAQTVEGADKECDASSSNEKDTEDTLEERVETAQEKEQQNLEDEKTPNESAAKEIEQATNSNVNDIQDNNYKLKSAEECKVYASSTKIEDEQNLEDKKDDTLEINLGKEATDEQNLADVDKLDENFKITSENIKQRKSRRKKNESEDATDKTQINEEKDEVATSTKITQQLEDKNATTLDTPSKAKRQTNRKQSQSPTKMRNTESKTEYDGNALQDSDVKKDVRSTRRDKAGAKGADNATKQDETKAKEQLLQEVRMPTNRSKTRKLSNEPNKEDNAAKAQTTAGRSQTPQTKKTNRKKAESAKGLEKPEEKQDETTVDNNKNADGDQCVESAINVTADNNKIKESNEVGEVQQTQENKVDTSKDNQTKRIKTKEEKTAATPPSTPNKPDRRILVVSLKKTDLSKVLNEKLVRKKEESLANKAESVSKADAIITEKREDNVKNRTVSEHIKDGSSAIPDAAHDIKSIVEEQTKEQQSDTSTGNNTPTKVTHTRNKKQRRGQQNKIENKKDDKSAVEGRSEAEDAIAVNKKELKEIEVSELSSHNEQDNKNESEIPSTSKAAAAKGSLKTKTRKAKVIESALDENALVERDADGKKAENVIETDNVPAVNAAIRPDTVETVVSSERSKRRRVEAKLQEKEKKTEGGNTANEKDKNLNTAEVETESTDENQKQNTEHKTSKVDTIEVIESLDEAKEQKLPTQISDNIEEKNVAAESSHETDNEKEGVNTAVKSKRDNKRKAKTTSRKSRTATKSSESTHADKAENKTDKEVTNEGVHNITEAEVVTESIERETDKVLDKKPEHEVSTENESTDKTESDKNMEPVEVTDGEVETQETVFEAKVLRKRVNTPSDKRLKPEKATDAKDHIQMEAESAKSPVKEAHTSLDKKVEAAEGIEEEDKMEENIVEPKTLRRRDKKVKPAEEITDGKDTTQKEVAEATTSTQEVSKSLEPEEVLEDKDKTEENIVEPKTLRKRDRKVKLAEEVTDGKDTTQKVVAEATTSSQEVSKSLEQKLDPEEVLEDKDKREGNIVEPKTLRKRDKKVKPAEEESDGKNTTNKEVAEATTSTQEVSKSLEPEEVLEDKDKTEENIVEPKTLRKRDRKVKPAEEVTDGKDTTQKVVAEATTSSQEVSKSLEQKLELEEVLEDKDKAEENIVEPKTLRKRANKPLQGKAEEKQVMESTDTIQGKTDDVSGSKDHTQEAESEIDKSLDKKEQSEEVKEDKDETQDLVLKPNTRRLRANKTLPKKEEQKLVVESTDHTTEEKEGEAKIAQKAIDKPLDKEPEAEALNEKAEIIQETKPDTTEGIAEDKRTEENSDPPLDNKCDTADTATGAEGAVKRETKRKAAKKSRSRSKKAANKKSEPAMENENANENLENIIGTEVRTENVDSQQELDSAVTEAASENAIEKLGKEEAENRTEESQTESEPPKSIDEVEKVEKAEDAATNANESAISATEADSESKHARTVSSKRVTRKTDNTVKAENSKNAAINEEHELTVNEPNESKNDAKNAEDETNQNEQQEDDVARHLITPIPKYITEREELDVGASGSEETVRSLRSRHLLHHTDAAGSTPSPVTTPAHSATTGSEDEASGRRTLRKRAADQSPSNANELAKKGLRATPSTTNAATIAQKLIREQPNSNRNLTVTPTSTTRKRVRDIPQQNTNAEKNDPDKSPLEKKTKIDSFRKSSRLHEEGETSGSEIDSSVVPQRRSRVSGIKDNPTNKNIRDNSTSLERKATQQPVTKDNADADINETTIRSQSPRKRDKSTTNNTNAGKSQAPTTTISATAEANKKRTKQALENMQPAKKALRANENETIQQQQQRQAAMTQRNSTKQSAASTSTTEIQQQQQHAETNEASGDPLQIPTKRVRRLQAIDSYDAINASSDVSTSKAAEELEKQNMANLPKRKSLRAVAAGPSDGAKPNEGNKIQVKQQAQQQQQPSTRIVETNRVTASRSITNALKAQTSPTKSSLASKVLTFTEWLEQQKKNGEPKRGEEVETTTQAEEIATRAKANLDTEKSNVLTATVAAAAAASSSKPTEVMNITVSGSEKELRQRAAATNKRKELSMTAGNKAQNGPMAEMIKATSTAAAAARQTHIEKIVGVGANDTNTTNTKSAANRTTTQFKRPSLPQKQAGRSTKSSAGGNRTPTQMQGNNNNAPHNGKQTELHKVNIKSKLRKLRVRINRSTVPAYFKKLSMALSRGQEKNDVEQKFSTPADTALPDNATKPQRPPLPITQKRVPMRSAIQVQKQLPTLTARPTVAAASSTNNMSRVGGSLPPLTKVPSPLERIATRHQDDMNISQNTTAGYQHNNAEELSLLTPMKSVAVPTTTTTSRSQQQQQKSQLASSAAAEAIREKRTSATSSTDTSSSTTRTQATVAPANTNSNLTKDTTTAFIPFVPKEEIVDEQQQQQQHTTQAVVRTSNTAAAAAAADSSSVSTNSLASRTLAIAAATNSALSQPATSDPSGYYGLTPTQLDANGTRLYSFLHPAKYNRNHGCVLLDYCCPNLDGPMPAIDPTRIHAQVQAGVRELPAYIVMTTKLITRADLEANKSVIPASIRQKVEKITADAQSVSNQMPPSVPGAAVNGTPNLQNALTSKPPQLPNAASTAATAQAKSTLTPTITALQKHLPSTTSITPKLMPPAALTSASSSSTSAAVAAAAGTSSGSGTPTPNGPTSGPHMLLSDYQRSVLRTSVRQFDARLKKYYYRIALLSFSDRQKIIDNIITTTTLIPKDVEGAVRLLDAYAAQIATLPNAPTAASGPVNAKPTGATAQSTSKAIITQTTNTVPTARTNIIQQQQLQQQQHHQQLQQQQQNQRNSNGQGAVLDKDNSLLGYQLGSSTSATMALNKSTVSTRSSIMSTGFKNTSMPNVSTASGGVLPALKSAQDSPRIFYTKHPMQTSTPIATTTSSGNASMSGDKSISLRSAPRVGRDMTIRQMPTTLASVSSTSVTSTPPATRRLPALTRNPHLSTSNTATPNSSATETITTRSAVTISTAPKRMTRASAAAKVIVITQNSEGGANTPSDECILPDEHNNTEIKREKMDDDFVGGN